MDQKPDTEAPVPDDQEKALVKKYKRAIERELSRHEDRFRSYEANRSAYGGIVDGNPVRTNLIFSTIATIYPQVYAKNPDISFSPAEAVSDDQYKDVKNYARTAEVVINRLLVRGADLKSRMKSATRATMICQVGWLKLTYQKDVREDPEIRNRMNDVQDDIERLRALQAEADDVGLDQDTKLAELQAQLDSMKRNVETVVSSGLVLDKLMTEDLLILDPTVRDFSDYLNSSAIAQRTWMDEDRFMERFGRKPTAKANKWQGKSIKDASAKEGGTSSAAGDKEACFSAVWEIWDKNLQTIYTWCEGEEGWCRDPFQPQNVGRRWYPFFGLCFNPKDGELYGLSDVELLRQLQEEYNLTRDSLAEHRKTSIPIRVIRSGGSLSPSDVDKLQQAQYGDAVVVGGDSGVPLSNDVTSLEGPRIDPALYDTSMIRTDIEQVSGASDAARGMVSNAKTATEAEIMQQGLASRTGERQDIIEDMIEDMSKYAIEILTGELSLPEVVRMAGQDAVWPLDGNIDAVFDTLDLEIRAGSTGKPNKNGEREQWIKLMPILQDTMQRVAELRQTGQDDMADALVELSRESLRRFDERIDIDSFLPRRSEDPNAPQNLTIKLQQATMQNQQLQQAVTQLQQQLQQATQQLQGKQQELTFKATEGDKDRATNLEMKRMELEANAQQEAITEALAINQDAMKRLQQIETVLQSMPPPEEDDGEEEAAEREALLNEVRAMIAQIPPPVAPTVIKRGIAKPNPDGSFSMEVIEEPVNDRPAT